MSPFLPWSPAELGLWSAETLLKLTLLLAITALGMALLRRRPAAQRAALWAALIVSCFSIPVAMLLLPRVEVAGMPSLGTLVELAAREDTGSGAPSSGSEVHRRTGRPPSQAATAGGVPTLSAPQGLVPTESATTPGLGAEQLHGDASFTAGSPTPRSGAFAAELAGAVLRAGTTALPLLWALGAGFVLLRLGWSMSFAARLRSRSTSVEDQRIEAMLEFAWEAEPGLHRRPAVAFTNELRSPAVAGWRRPIVLLPREASRWSDERLALVFAHELHHLARHDLVWRVVAKLACAVYWFHPLLWWVARQLTLEQERACDEAVLARGTKPSTYASHLLDLAHGPGRVRAVALVPLATRATLETRMMNLLDASRRERGPHPGGARPLAIACLMLTAATVLAILGPVAAQNQSSVPNDDGAAREVSVVVREMRQVEEEMQIIEQRMQQAESAAGGSLVESDELERALEPLEREIEAVEREMQAHEERLGAMEVELEGLEPMVEEIERELEPLVAEMEALEAQLEPFEEEMERIGEEIVPWEEEHGAIERIVEPLAERLEVLAGEIDPIERRIREERRRLERAREDGDAAAADDARRALETARAEAEPLRLRMRETSQEIQAQVQQRLSEPPLDVQRRMEEVMERMRPIQDEMLQVQQRMEPIVERIASAHLERQPHYERMAAAQEEMRPYIERIEAIHERMRPEIEAVAERHAAAAPHYERVAEIAREMQPHADRMGSLGRELQRALVARIVGELRSDPRTAPQSDEVLERTAEEILQEADVWHGGLRGDERPRLRIDRDDLIEVLTQKLSLGEADVSAVADRLLGLEF